MCNTRLRIGGIPVSFSCMWLHKPQWQVTHAPRHSLTYLSLLIHSLPVLLLKIFLNSVVAVSGSLYGVLWCCPLSPTLPHRLNNTQRSFALWWTIWKVSMVAPVSMRQQWFESQSILKHVVPLHNCFNVSLIMGTVYVDFGLKHSRKWKSFSCVLQRNLDTYFKNFCFFFRVVEILFYFIVFFLAGFTLSPFFR